MIRTRYDEAKPYTTKDGSVIRELMHPSLHGGRMQSLAEATVPPGAATKLHRHAESEELYHITEGSGSMTVGSEQFDVGSGDTVLIPPGTPHRIANTGAGPLRILCACAPPYAHGDTELVEG